MKAQKAWPWAALARWEGIGGGAAVLINTGIHIEFIRQRWAAGETIAELAEDYDLHPSLIEQGLREWVNRPRDWRKRVAIKPNLARRKR